MKPVFSFLLQVLFSQLLFSQTTWYVRAGASPVGADGSNWATATPYLHDALDAAQAGDVIWISEGTYKPSTEGDRYRSFNLKNDVRVYGGFAGTESELGQRDWVAHPTILSGDIGTPGLASDNSFCILYATHTSLNTRVDGLVFEDATANNPDNVGVLFYELGHSGGAIYLNGQNPGNYANLALVNCTFRRNWSDFYGAVYANGRNGGKSAVLVDGCLFEGNNCGGAGGGLAIDNDAAQPDAVQILHSAFRSNYAYNRGGGLLLSHHANVTVQNCAFVRDSIRFNAGGALAIEGDFLNAQYRFDNCLFDQNLTGSGAVGGAILIGPNYSNLQLNFRSCVFSHHKTADVIWNPALFGSQQNVFQNCIFRENTVANLIYGEMVGVSGEQRYTNCLFYNNSGAEIFDGFNASPPFTHRLQNCILVKAPSARLTNGSPKVILEHCLVSQANCGALGTGVTCGAGMLYGADPMFANPAAGDFHLQPCSPAINAGDNTAALAAGPANDAEGHARVLNGTVDLGPYEHDLFLAFTTIHPASCAGSGDGAVTISGYFCPPLLVSWTNGLESGARTDSLAPGRYAFSFQDAEGHSETDTLIVPIVPPIEIKTMVANVTCFGLSDGSAGLDLSGGTPPYQIAWANGNTSGFLFSLPPGSYPVTVTDARGCTATEAVDVQDPGLIQVFYTVTPVTVAGQSDGRIQIDSVIGCNGPFQWPAPDLNNLKAGSYTITVTDPCGCVFVLPITVPVAVGTGEAVAAGFPVWLSPNPAAPGQSARLRWADGPVETVWIQDAAGRIIRAIAVPPGADQLELPNAGAPGIYWLTLHTGNQRRALRWVVAGGN